MRDHGKLTGRAALALLAFLWAAACESPDTPQYWTKKLASKKEQGLALKKLKKMYYDFTQASEKGEKPAKAFDPAAVAPAILQLAKEKDLQLVDRTGEPVLAEVAWYVAELKIKEAAEPLISHLNFAVGAGKDRETKRLVEANQEIAHALGELRHEGAVETLTKLLKAKDAQTQLEVIRALGKIASKAAVRPLLDILYDPNAHPFLLKNAIVALGEVGSSEAVQGLVKYMCLEKPGVSFYRESSFALFQVGESAVEPLIKVVEGGNEELNRMAAEKNWLAGAPETKAAQVLGDLADPRATDALMKLLDWTSEFEDLKWLPRIKAAAALGWIGADKAIDKLTALLQAAEDATSREHISNALVEIGNRKVVPALLEAAKKGSSDARKASIEALTKLADASILDAYNKMIEDEKGRKFEEYTIEGGETFEIIKPYFDITEEEFASLNGLKSADPAAIAALFKPGNKIKVKDNKPIKHLQEAKIRLDAAAECNDRFECWAGKLKDPKADWRVREKAAFTIGYLKDPRSVDVLLEVVGVDNLYVRYAVIWALERLKADKGAEVFEAILKREHKRLETIKINENLKRLLVMVKKRAAKRN